MVQVTGEQMPLTVAVPVSLCPTATVKELTLTAVLVGNMTAAAGVIIPGKPKSPKPITAAHEMFLNCVSTPL